MVSGAKIILKLGRQGCVCHVGKGLKHKVSSNPEVNKLRPILKLLYASL